MQSIRVDWLLIARDLAAHLRGAQDLEVVQRILDQAQADAVSLGAPSDWWETLGSEYQALARSASSPDSQLVREMILNMGLGRRILPNPST
jgi:hypothetical protein